jgi:hypothetical protein
VSTNPVTLLHPGDCFRHTGGLGHDNATLCHIFLQALFCWIRA